MRSPISALPVERLLEIQKGTMRYSWRGVTCNKSPFDLALYPLLLWQVKPATIFEIGSKFGGSALWLADTCQMFGLPTKLISVDINQRAEVEHPAITFLQGNGRKLEKTLTGDLIGGLPRPWLVIEDADHSYATTLAVLKFFDRYLQTGEYILIEDGIVDSFGWLDRFKGGPNKAVSEFMAERAESYELDTDFNDYFGYNATWNTNGYLKRIA